MDTAAVLSARPIFGVGAPRRIASASSVYACSVLISEAGYAVNVAQLQGYAARHAYTVLMANHGGALICAAPGSGNTLVVATREGGQWRGDVREVLLAR